MYVAGKRSSVLDKPSLPFSYLTDIDILILSSPHAIPQILQIRGKFISSWCCVVLRMHPMIVSDAPILHHYPEQFYSHSLPQHQNRERQPSPCSNQSFVPRFEAFSLLPASCAHWPQRNNILSLPLIIAEELPAPSYSSRTTSRMAERNGITFSAV